MMRARTQDLRQALGKIGLSPAGLSSVRGHETVGAALAQLVGAGNYADAAGVIAVALPKHYGVAWLIDCFRQAGPAPVADQETENAALSIAEQWFRDPSEARRRVAAEFSARSGRKTAGAWLATAIAWSGGSLGPPNSAPVKPPEHLTAVALRTALKLLAARRGPQRGVATQMFVAQALRSFKDV